MDQDSKKTLACGLAIITVVFIIYLQALAESRGRPNSPETWLLLVSLLFYPFMISKIARTRLLLRSMFTNLVTFSSWSSFGYLQREDWSSLRSDAIALIVIVIFGLVSGGSAGVFAERLLKSEGN